MKKYKKIHASATELTDSKVVHDISEAKREGYTHLAYEWEPLIGPFVEIDLDNYSEDGTEKSKEKI